MKYAADDLPYTQVEVSIVVTTALIKPDNLDLPFGPWIGWRRTSTSRKGCSSNGDGSTRSCKRKDCAGASMSTGSASGLTLISPKKGAHHHALHSIARKLCRRKTRRDGTRVGQELFGPATGSYGACGLGTDSCRDKGYIFGTFQPTTGDVSTCPMTDEQRSTGSTFSTS